MAPIVDPPPETMKLSLFGAGLSQVAEVRWAAAVDEAGIVHGQRVAQMLDAAVGALTASTSPWKEWGLATQRIGVKVNAITCQAFSHPELATALAKGLVGAGADPARVTVWDRDKDGLERRGYTLDSSGAQGYRCLGTDSLQPQSRESVTVAGKILHLSPLLSESDLTFNIAALKDHSMAGVSLSLKNNFGAIYGADMLHGNIRGGAACEPGISELAAQPAIRDRLQLAVIDALIGICDGGPGSTDDLRNIFRYAGILVSRDPVALDRRGLAIIERQRAARGLAPLAERTEPNPSPPLHIDGAAERGVSPG